MKNVFPFFLILSSALSICACKNQNSSQSISSSEHSSSVSDTDSSTSSSRNTNSSTSSSRSSSTEPISYTEPKHEEITSIKGSYRMTRQSVTAEDIVLKEINYFYIDFLSNNDAYFVFDDENTDGEEIHKVTYEIVFDNRIFDFWNYYCDFNINSPITVGSFTFRHEYHFCWIYCFSPPGYEDAKSPEWKDVFGEFGYETHSFPNFGMDFILDEERTSQLDTIYSL